MLKVRRYKWRLDVLNYLIRMEDKFDNNNDKFDSCFPYQGKFSDPKLQSQQNYNTHFMFKLVRLELCC